MKKWIFSVLRDVAHVGLWVLLVGVPTVLMVNHVWTQYRITKLGYEISEETTRHKRLVEQRRRLTIERRVQARSRGFADVAEQRFGLERIRPEQIIEIDADATGAERTLANKAEPGRAGRP